MTDQFIHDQARAWEEIREWAQEAEQSPFAYTQPGGSWDGPGSSLACAEPLATALPAMLKRLDVGTMLDIGCGDWNWMRLVDLGSIEYTGWDVDPGRIARCYHRIGTGDFSSIERPNTFFEIKNVLTADVTDLGNYDLVLIRDVLAHLPNDHIEHILSKLNASGSQYLLASNYPDASNNWTYDPSQFAWNGYMEHPVSLEAQPFGLKKLDHIVEERGPGGVLTQYHELALFRLGGSDD